MAEVEVDSSGIIRVMPDVLANKIAAGEVVQRPASVVKELVENAIDAGATSIDVIIKASGKELIQVVDNGSGMSKDDALLSFRRHATSKIQTIEDLERIRTLGFRGEALASIAAVSRVELRTRRTTDHVGSLVRLAGGKLEDTRPCAAAEGTNVAVRNLFYNVPARRNFLKSSATELRHIIDTVQYLALANPRLSWRLTHDGSELVSVVGSREREAVAHRIEGLFGREISNELVPVDEATSYLTLRGFAGAPQIYRKSTGDQYLFVNGRIVRSRYLSHAVRAAYGKTLPESTYPFFVLYLELDPRHVDVNVHPTKAEVKFDDESGVYGFVKAVVRRALGVADMVPQFDDSAGSGFMSTVFEDIDSVSPRTDYASSPPDRAYQSGDAVDNLWSDGFYANQKTESGTIARLNRSLADGEAQFRFWQLDDKYIVAPLRSGLLLVDQFRAHERILFEKAMASLQSKKAFAQQLLFPQTLEFSPADYNLLSELMPELRTLGFEIEEFGGRSVIVRGIPADLKESSTPSILGDLLDQYRENIRRGQMRNDENLARSIARRGAVSHGVRLSPTEMAGIVDQLFLCESPHACPAGRSTMIRIPVDELTRRFGRG